MSEIVMFISSVLVSLIIICMIELRYPTITKPKRKRKPQGAYDAVDWNAVSAKQKMAYEMLEIKREHGFEMAQLNKKHMEQVSKYSEEIVSLSDENQRLREALREHGIVYEYDHENGTSFMMRKVDSDD